MSPESLQSLSVGAVFVGLILTALGGFGAFHFGHKVERAADQERALTVQSLSESIATLQLEQRGLRAWVSAVEEKVAQAPPPAPAPAPVAATPPPSLAAVPPPPAIAEGPPDTAKVETPETVKPPKLLLPTPSAPETAAEPAVSTPPTILQPAASEKPALSPLQRAALIKRLRGHSQHGLAIHAAEGDPQALELAAALRSAFREAGWQVNAVDTVSHHLPTTGLLLSTGVFPPREDFIAAYSALERAGFLVTSDLDPNQSSHHVILFVGPKN